MKYFQCELQRKIRVCDGAGDRETTTVVELQVVWIPEHGAKVGNIVELLTDDGELWAVAKVFEPGIDEAAMREKQRLDRGSLPSLQKA